ncbi:unnamed protein product [Allacma fusca]|uniref:Peptidase M12A domain-containing protein n=1 Tax=Allacma fusca TaxID=39272 RepID=A0A8J2Q237_9HEXA|nr:unnamed protein product [Allacma fusca]
MGCFALMLLFLTTIFVEVLGVPLDSELVARASLKEGKKRCSQNPSEGEALPGRKDNMDERGKYHGGDMVLTPDQLGELKQGINGDNYRWPGGIVPYVIDTNFSPSERTSVLAGINLITSKTCIKFTNRTAENSYVFIRRGNDGTGCYSSVGRQASQPQVVNIQGNYPSGTCAYPGIVAHELIHALGFYHEHSRTDRDDFITVSWSNINGGSAYNFDKYPASFVSLFGVSYDYDSLMHYSAYAFAINHNLPTLIPKQSGVSNSRLGQRSKVSTLDAQKINTMYKDLCT